jgi:hypothetical protein
MKLFPITSAALLFAALPIFASTIVSDLGGTGTTDASPAFGAFGWTQTGTFTDVTIDAFIGDLGIVAPATGIAYLMSQIGPGTTAADEVTAPDSFSLPYGPSGLTQLFTNLTLGPGTYYLVIDPTSNFAWDQDSIPNQTLAPGVTQLPDKLGSNSIAAFAPATSFTSQQTDTNLFSVTGTLSSTATSPVPEPSMAVLLAIGLGGVSMLKRKRVSQLQ